MTLEGKKRPVGRRLESAWCTDFTVKYQTPNNERSKWTVQHAEGCNCEWNRKWSEQAKVIAYLEPFLSDAGGEIQMSMWRLIQITEKTPPCICTNKGNLRLFCFSLFMIIKCAIFWFIQTGNFSHISQMVQLSLYCFSSKWDLHFQSSQIFMWRTMQNLLVLACTEGSGLWFCSK